MKTTKKQSSKFQLDTFEVAKIKNMKMIRGGDGGGVSDDKTSTNTFCDIIKK